MESFLKACGVETSLQLVVESPSPIEPELRLLYQPFAVIGRDPRADVRLDSAEVSRRHVYLQIVEGRAFWVDMESRTGTQIEKSEQKFGWLEGEETLSVGSYIIRRFVGDRRPAYDFSEGKQPRSTPLIAQSYSHSPLPDVALEFLNGPSQSISWPVRRVMSLIGSASGCKFRLTDPSVSRYHASLLRTAEGVWIVDLLGKDGITINQIPVRSGRVGDGDVVGIGRYQLRVRCRHRANGSGSGSLDDGGERSPFVSSASKPDHDSMTVMYSDWIAAAIAVANRSKDKSELQLPQLTQPQPSLRGIEVVSSVSSLPVEFTQSGPTESVLVPLVNQFGLMQQQMFGQFQQAMAMMVQMFGTMHREQMEVIRAELDRLHELTDEIHALKEELANRTRQSVQTTQVESEKYTQMAEAVSGKPPHASSPSRSVSNGPQVLGTKPTPKVEPKSPTSGGKERGSAHSPGFPSANHKAAECVTDAVTHGSRAPTGPWA